MLTFQEIENSWKEFCGKPFPDVGDGEVEDVDLIYLDSTAAGCIDTFVRNRGKIDADRIGLLKKAEQDLIELGRHLDGAPAVHFGQLHRLTRAVLEHTED